MYEIKYLNTTVFSP